jgi:predicted amidophosphoribosyltransferase
VTAVALTGVQLFPVIPHGWLGLGNLDDQAALRAAANHGEKVIESAAPDSVGSGGYVRRTMTDWLLPQAEFPGCHDCANFAAGPARTCLACASQRLSRPSAECCPICSQRLGPGGGCPNELCRSPHRRIGKIHAIGYQSGSLRRVINSYKYRGTRSWSVVLGRLLLAWLDERMAADPPGLIVANPGFVGPGGQEFGHAEAVLAAAAGADVSARWPFDRSSPAAVIKTQPTLKSADAQAWSKRATGYELRAALEVPDPRRTAGKFILIYDDVCTTGTQLDAVAGCLLDQGGAARVEGVVLARATWRGQDRKS